MTLPLNQKTITRAQHPRQQPRSAFASVLRGIGFGIVAGEFPIGQTLPNKEVLMRRFGVSNTSLREALKTLEAKGMVAARTKIGYWVREENDWNLLDEDLLGWRLEVGVDARFIGRLFEMRQSIEPVAAALAATRRSEAQLSRLDTLTEEMTKSGLDRQRFTNVDLEFHLLVVEASGNPMMRSIGALIGAALAASFRLSAPTDSLASVQRAWRQHSAIVEALRRRDPQAAADAMIVVIDQGWANFSGASEPTIATVGMRRFDGG